MTRWHVITSNKPKRQGEAFLQRNGKFVLKIYKEAPVPNVLDFAHWLAKQLNDAEKRRNAEKPE